MKKILKLLTNRAIIISLLILIQLIVLYLALLYADALVFNIIYIVAFVLDLIIVLHIVGSPSNPGYKISWIILILCFQIFGGLFYFIYHQWSIKKRKRKRVAELTNDRLLLNEASTNTIDSSLITKEERYLNSHHFPSYTATKSTFFKTGESLFEQMFADIKSAKKYILLEFFIIKKSNMWDKLLHLLTKKAEEGLDIKILYDDFGSNDLSYFVPRKLKKLGIEAVPFNILNAKINLSVNHRDHRKIVIIDGNIAFTGGVNIGDEYDNSIVRFGHWCDVGVKLNGLAVWSLVVAFFENWRFTKNISIDYEKYKNNCPQENDGIVIPFTDTPLDKAEITKDIYINLITNAKSTIYITTPYLILDYELLSALTFAAQAGLDVKIIIPGIPDKKIVYAATNAYVPELLEAGVKVYKYTPGFLYAKLLIIDNKIMTMGSTNLDYRSLYLHFENNCLFENCSCIKEAGKFVEDVLLKSKEIKQSAKRSLLKRLFHAFLKVFGPLL